MTRYLTVAEVVELHDRIMERTGARPEALRDEGLLESALMRAQTAAYYEEADLVTQAVLMAVGISQNQPFVDGNKRAAFVTLDIFLRVNGLEFQGEPLELAMRIEQIAEDQERRAEATSDLTHWLQARVESR
jgi:death-on-curing protein